MAIRQYNENNRMLYEVYLHGHNSRGLRVQRKRRGIETLRKAETLEFELRRELSILKEESVALKWGEWVHECLAVMKINSRPSTLYSYEKTLTKWVNRHWNQIEINRIDKRLVHELLFESMPSGTSQHTRKYVLKIIKRVFQMAVDHGKLDRNPCLGMMIKTPEPEKKVLTNEEARILLSEAKITNHRFYPIWIMALFTGMRSGELYALRWSDVNLDEGIIHVSRSWSSKNGFSSTKNQKTRQVPISSELLHFLKEYKLQRKTEEFVLPHLTEWTRGDAAEVTRNFCKSLNLTDIRFHDLRATFITNLLSRGESLARVMAVVGHSDMETTNVYLRKAGIELKGATDKLGYAIPQTIDAVILKFSK